MRAIATASYDLTQDSGREQRGEAGASRSERECRHLGESKAFGAATRPRLAGYLLRYIQADSAIKTTVMIQSEESLIPVFLAMRRY